jgi:hypothetical protein
MSTFLRKAIWNFWNLLGKRAARSYIAGPELQDAMRVYNELSEKGFSTTMDSGTAMTMRTIKCQTFTLPA